MKNEQNQTILAGKVPVGYKQTEVGIIPEDWEVYSLDDVIVSCSSGGTPSRSNKSFYKGSNRWITSGELNYCKIFDTQEKISNEAIVKSNLKIHPVGTFLMAITGLEAEGTRGACGIVGAPSTTNQSCMAIYPNEKLKSEYLYYWYVGYGNSLAFKYCQGTKQLSYTANLVRKIPIHIPKSLKEQTAIAEALSDVDSLLVSLEKLIEKKRAIKTGTMQQLLTGKKRLPAFAQREDGTLKGYKTTELGEIPEDWEIVTMGDIGWIYGGLSGKKKEDFSKGNAKYIPFTNVMSNIVIDLNKLDKVIVNESQNRVLKNDLLFNGSSETPEELCLCSIIDVDVENLYLNSFCFGFRNKNQDVVEKFLAYFYRSNIGRNLIQAIAQGSTRYNISKKQFLNLQIPLPPKAEQTAIAEILSDMDAEIEALEAKRAKTEEIKQGMMQELLTGRTRLI